jgi:hypothetical protein
MDALQQGQGQAGLAHPTGPGEREQPHLGLEQPLLLLTRQAAHTACRVATGGPASPAARMSTGGMPAAQPTPLIGREAELLALVVIEAEGPAQRFERVAVRAPSGHARGC